MQEQMQSRHPITKWLQMLFYIGAASLGNSLLSLLPIVPAQVTTWVSRAITLAMIYTTLQMGYLNPRYKKAALYRALMLGCTLITAFLSASSLITLAASVFSIMAVYQEYSAHSELVADKYPALSGKWHSLFNWGIIVSVLISAVSVIAVLVVALTKMDTASATAVIAGVLMIPQFVLDVLYLRYINRMVLIFGSEVDSNGL